MHKITMDFPDCSYLYDKILDIHSALLRESGVIVLKFDKAQFLELYTDEMFEAFKCELTDMYSFLGELELSITKEDIYSKYCEYMVA